MSPEEDQISAIGNTYKKLLKIAYVVLEICAMTGTHTNTQTCPVQTSVMAHHGEILLKFSTVIIRSRVQQAYQDNFNDLKLHQLKI